MTRLGILVLCAALIAPLVGCGDDDAPQVSFADWAEEHRTQVDAVCDCYEELSWDNRSECTSGQDRIGPSQENCVEEVLAGDKAAFDTFVSCYLPLQRDLTACVDEQLECSDEQGGLAPCLEDYDVGERDCDAFSASVTRDLDDCGVELGSLEVMTGAGGCTETCEFTGDGECDDGGPNADFSECELGTDCTDCGPR